MAGNSSPNVLASLSLLLLVLAILATDSGTSVCEATSYEVVKSQLYPHLPTNVKPFSDRPVHGPPVAIQVWYSDTRVFGFRTTFSDKFRSPIHGYAAGNTSTIYFDPKTDDFLTTPFVEFGNLAPDGTVGAIGLGLEAGNRTVSLCGGRSTKERKPHADPRFLPEFGSPFKLEAVGYSSPAVILGFTGLADDAHIVQVGAIIEARTLSLAQSPSPQLRQRLSWPKDAVVRVREYPRLATGLRPFDDGATAEHGEVVKVQVWPSESLGVQGIRSTFQDGYRTRVHGFAKGESITVEFDPESNPLVAVGGRGGPSNLDYPGIGESALVGDKAGEYKLLGVAFYRGGTNPPIPSPVYGAPFIRTYSDSADGKIVGFFGQLGNASIEQLGVHVVSPANGLVISSGPFPRVVSTNSVPFDHTGDNLGVDKIDVYYDDEIGILGLRFTYITEGNFKYTTPIYGRELGSHKQLQFDYVDNPLVNVGVYIANVLAGTGEVGLLGLTFRTLKGDFIGTFGCSEDYFNLSDGRNRVVGFHGKADTVINALGVYTAPV